jgi:hypothetical protein
LNVDQIIEYLTSEADEIRDVLASNEGYQTEYFTGALEAIEGAIKFIQDDVLPIK